MTKTPRSPNKTHCPVYLPSRPRGRRPSRGSLIVSRNPIGSTLFFCARAYAPLRRAVALDHRIRRKGALDVKWSVMLACRAQAQLAFANVYSGSPNGGVSGERQSRGQGLVGGHQQGRRGDHGCGDDMRTATEDRHRMRGTATPATRLLHRRSRSHPAHRRSNSHAKAGRRPRPACSLQAFSGAVASGARADDERVPKRQGTVDGRAAAHDRLQASSTRPEVDPSDTTSTMEWRNT